MDSFSKVPVSAMHEKQQLTLPFQVFPRVAKTLVLELNEVTFWMRCACMKDRNNADLLLEVLCSCVNDRKQKKFLQLFYEAASQIDRNWAPFVKTFRVR